jgi:hypothetical protein
MLFLIQTPISFFPHLGEDPGTGEGGLALGISEINFDLISEKLNSTTGYFI